MRAALHYHSGWTHQENATRLMAEGLARHGVETRFAGYNEPIDADMVVIWGWRQPLVIEAASARGIPVLVMERAHIQPRELWTSCGFGGLGRRALYPACQDAGTRWDQYFAHHLCDWRDGGGDYALVCGQIPGDAALGPADIRKWAESVIAKLLEQGQHVLFRPHPLRYCVNDTWIPDNCSASLQSSLNEDLAQASFVVTYNSTAGIEAVLSGKPTITWDPGSMAWPVTSHRLDEPLMTLDRTEWCHDLAWTQWLPDEIAAGNAWDALKICLPQNL